MTRSVARAVESLEVLPVFSKFIGSETKTLSMIESHGDQVVELPEGAVLLATSPTCVNEIWCLRNVLAIQSHPEFTPKQMFKYILPMLKQEKWSPKLHRSCNEGCCSGFSPRLRFDRMRDDSIRGSVNTPLSFVL